MFKCDAVKIYGQEICGQEMRSQVRGFCESEGVRTLSRKVHPQRNRTEEAPFNLVQKAPSSIQKNVVHPAEIIGFNLFCILFCLANQAFRSGQQTKRETELEFTENVAECHGLATAILYVP